MKLCLGCLQEKKLKSGYCAKCIKEIFDGIVPLPLAFDKNEFYIQRKELASKMSISGVQDKIFLKFEDNKLITTASNGKYILKPAPNSYQIKGTIINNKSYLSNNAKLYYIKSYKDRLKRINYFFYNYLLTSNIIQFLE